ncbi:DNA polymerase family X, beta-like [Parasponia andersonii]|uniref:DNA polymerase n=1 Tax=Parasponia andersonii TaxID=3476 RepID=A0A2P5D1R9_PARAD|nr:DNA polymerase family X, beta-like [Parasponia andersonii]
MVQKRKKKEGPPAPTNAEPAGAGIFAGMVAFLVENGVQSRRLQIWKHKLEQMGAIVEERLTERVTHLFAMNSDSLLQKLGGDRLARFQGRALLYQWLEDSLTSGEKVSEDMYDLKMKSESEAESIKHKSSTDKSPKRNVSSDENEEQDEERQSSDHKKTKSFHSRIKANTDDTTKSNKSALTFYNPPDLNKNITQIFGKLIDIYRALGDNRRSFSYYKAIPVIEKLPFKIESAEQIKHLPSIGKSLQDHIQEIVTTGKLSKLEHFETDEKVRTISLFGEVWGVGPATALKLYEKGHRSLDDLKNENSLTHAQKVQEMESLLKKAGEQILPEVEIICGGSFRRGKASCGDMDIVITHPDGKSHKGFLQKFVKHLKEIKFLREDLIFSTHSEQDTDSGVDTYFGLCTYPGRELRHRIDFKVYPREIFAFGLIAWTGNDVLNRRLRLLAESNGFRLDDTGLFPATHGSPGKRGTKATASLKFNEEKEAFDFLGFPWLEPHERNL